MASLATLAIDFIANMAPMSRDLKKGEKDLESFGAKAGRLAKGALVSLGSGMASAVGHAVKLGAALTAVGAGFAAYKGVRLLLDAAEQADALGKASKRLGVSVQFLSGMKFAAGEAGQEFESLAKSIGKMGKNVAELVSDGSRSVGVGALTVRLTDAAGQIRPLEQLLPEIAAGIESIGSEAEQLRISEKFFGREGGTQFVTLLKDGGNFLANFNQQMERAGRLNLILTDDQVEKMTAFNGALGQVKEAWTGLGYIVMTQVAPALTGWANQTASIIASMPDILKRLALAFGDSSEGLNVRGNLVEAVQEAWATIRTFVWDGSLALLRALSEQIVAIAISTVQEIQNRTGGMLSGIMAGMGNPAAAQAITMMSASSAGKGFWERTAENRKAVFGDSDEAAKWWEEVKLHAALAGQAIDRAGGISEAVGAHSMTVLADGTKAAGEALSETAKKAAEAAEKWKEFVKGFGKELRETIEGFAGGASNAFADLVVDGKASFADLAKSWGKTLVAMATQYFIFKPLFTALGANMGGIFGDKTGTNVKTEAMGDAFLHGRVLAFAGGGVVSSPTLFPMARGTGLMGEAGPEAIMPLDRIGGKLGVRASGAGVTVNVYNEVGGQVETQERRGAGGERVVDVYLRKAVRRMLGDGTLDGDMRQHFGLSRRGTPR